MFNNDLIKLAVEELKKNNVIAIPTETVYGLAADARNETAIMKVFELKGRPTSNPLNIMVPSIEHISKYAKNIPEEAYILAEKFWPGPLTIILPKKDIISDLVTANKKTVGIRIPNHPVTLNILKQFDGPIVVPSANLYSEKPPVSAQEVKDIYKDKILIIDGGICEIGIASTIVDFSKKTPTILRHGSITEKEIEQICKKTK